MLITAPVGTEVFTVTTPMTVTGKAFSAYQFTELTLSVDGVQVDSQSVISKELDWSLAWTPDPPGSHVLTVISRDTHNRTFSDNVTIRVGNVLAPGGVDANLRLWLRADAGVVAHGDGTAVTSWRDHSNGWDAQNGANVTPLYNSESINFNPAVTFGPNRHHRAQLWGSPARLRSWQHRHDLLVVADPTTQNGPDRFVLDAGGNPNGGYGLALSNSSIAGRAPATDSIGSSQIAEPGFGSNGALLVTYMVEFGVGSRLDLTGMNAASTSNTSVTRIDASNVAYASAHGATSGPITLGRQAQDTNLANHYFRGDLGRGDRLQRRADRRPAPESRVVSGDQIWRASGR